MKILFIIALVSLALQSLCVWILWRQVKETDEFLRKLGKH